MVFRARGVIKIFSNDIECHPILAISVWADNADTLAKQYAGTGALKTDFTRSVMKCNVLKCLLRSLLEHNLFLLSMIFCAYAGILDQSF